MVLDPHIPINAAETANVLWFDGLLRHQTYLLRQSGAIRNQINALLNATEGDMARKILSALSGDTKLSPARLRRANALIKQLQALRASPWKEADKLWTESMEELTLTEVRQARKLLNAVVPVELDTILPAPGRLTSLVKTVPFEGKILSQWAQKIQADDISRIANQIRIGVVQGESAQKIARRVIGSAKLKGRDGVTQISRRQAEAITRTAVNHFGNQAREAYFFENQDIFTKEIYTATLDGRTTPICRSLDGQRFPVAEGPIPPLHFNCRSIRVAAISAEAIGKRPARPVTEKRILKTYAQKNQLGRVKSRADLPHGFKGDYDQFKRQTLRAMTGRVPAKVTYQTWLETQSVTFQDDILGPTRGRLFRKGNITLKRFVNRAGENYTLAELADREAVAFRAAGLDPGDF